MYFLIAYVSVCVWVIFFGGAERLEGTFKTILFFHPGMTCRELKFWAAISLITVPVYLFIYYA